MPKKKTDQYLPGDRDRGVNICVYDLQGGPIDPGLQGDLELAVFTIIKRYPNLALDIKTV